MDTKRRSNDHPMQQIVIASDKIIRFRSNHIVRDLLEFAEKKGFGMNEIGQRGYTHADLRQFAQLVGYSVDGFCSLGYANRKTGDAACKIASKKTRGRKRFG